MFSFKNPTKKGSSGSQPPSATSVESVFTGSAGGTTPRPKVDFIIERPLQPELDYGGLIRLKSLFWKKLNGLIGQGKFLDWSTLQEGQITKELKDSVENQVNIEQTLKKIAQIFECLYRQAQYAVGKQLYQNVSSPERNNHSLLRIYRDFMVELQEAIGYTSNTDATNLAREILNQMSSMRFLTFAFYIRYSGQENIGKIQDMEGNERPYLNLWQDMSWEEMEKLYEHIIVCGKFRELNTEVNSRFDGLAQRIFESINKRLYFFHDQISFPSTSTDIEDLKSLENGYNKSADVIHTVKRQCLEKVQASIQRAETAQVAFLDLGASGSLFNPVGTISKLYSDFKLDLLEELEYLERMYKNLISDDGRQEGDDFARIIFQLQPKRRRRINKATELGHYSSITPCKIIQLDESPA